MFNFDLIEKYFYVGGVRIEDVVHHTKEGAVVIHDLPRTVEQIEDWMSGKDYDRSAIEKFDKENGCIGYVLESE